MIQKVSIEIDGIDYEVPKEITVSLYGELMKRFELCENEEDKRKDLITVVMGIPFNIVRELSVEQLYELSTYLQHKIDLNDVEYINTFIYKDVEYGGLQLDKLTFGEYIDLAYLMRDEVVLYENIHKVCSILYRPVIDKKKDKVFIKPYNIEEHLEQSELFKELPLKYFIGAFNRLFTYLTKVKKEYEVLFSEELMDLPKDEEKKRDESNLPWYKLIMVLTGDDFTKIDYVTTRPMIECFNHLSYLTIKNEELKQLKNKNNVL